MTTSFSQATGIDAGSLEELLGDGGGTLPRVIPGLAPVAAPAPSADMPEANGNGNSHGTLVAGRRIDELIAAAETAGFHPIDGAQDRAALALHVKRSLRTAAPLPATSE